VSISQSFAVLTWSHDCPTRSRAPTNNAANNVNIEFTFPPISFSERGEMPALLGSPNVCVCVCVCVHASYYYYHYHYYYHYYYSC
jgi:hypothetical protein